VFASYALQWLVWRATLRRVWSTRWPSVHKKNAERLARGFLRLRGVYIKMGQVLSVLGTFLPSAYGEALRPLQDAVPPRPLPELLPRLHSVWGEAGVARLGTLDETAIAAASLAQVHRGTTHDGRVVAVKVLWPGIERLVELDLRVIRWVMPIVYRAFGFRQMRAVVEQLERMLHHELDYGYERENMERFRTMFAARSDVVVPSVLPELSGPGVLVMSFETGAKLLDVDAQRAQGSEPEAVAKTLVECYLAMLFEHRWFHADPHPGNFLVRPGNQLVMLDFGAVEPISEDLVAGIETVLMGGLMRDPTKVLEGVRQMGFVAEDGDQSLIDGVGREYLAMLGQLRIENFSSLDPDTVVKLSGAAQWKGRLREIASNLRYPDGYFYIERALLLLFGVVGRLSPKKGLLGIAAPYASRILLKNRMRRGSG
jgi:predicted unusual protein kinase regulating ubiquinone biosynthesis (AarF/ABC1/UbiB family)